MTLCHLQKCLVGQGAFGKIRCVGGTAVVLLQKAMNVDFHLGIKILKEGGVVKR